MRADVLALTPDSLAALTNRGLVKRAAREVEAAPPGIVEDADGTLRGRFADGAAPVLAEGGLERATCTCGATGVCRHVLGLILAYQAAGPPRPAVVDWSPGGISDERLAERIGARMMAAARRTRRAGYHARVRRPSAADPAARVDLGSATVRFLVPDDLGFVHTDAVAGARDDVIALAVWAFREADRAAPGQPEVLVDVEETGQPDQQPDKQSGRQDGRPEGRQDGKEDGNRSGGENSAGRDDTRHAGQDDGQRAGQDGGQRAGQDGGQRAGQDGGQRAGQDDGQRAGQGTRPSAGRSNGQNTRQRGGRAGREGGGQDGRGNGGEKGDRQGGERRGEDLAAALAGEVLLGGAVHLGAGIAARVAEVARRLEKDGLRWPLLAVAELAGQLEAYRDRGSGYAPERLAELIGELYARARAVRGGAARARVLGTEEAAETPLRRARLDGLGCRVLAAGSAATGDERRIVEVYLAHADSATVLVLRREWYGAEPGALLARHRIGGASARPSAGAWTGAGAGGSASAGPRSGASIGALAAGTLVTESAVRSASRAVRLGAGRVAKATVTASRGAWDRLPDGLLVRDFAALAGELDRLPPRVVRPRIEAELVRVLEVAEVRSVAYAPGRQRLRAVLADRHGNPATLVATHTAAAPGRLDALAEALARFAAEVPAGVAAKVPAGVAAGVAAEVAAGVPAEVPVKASTRSGVVAGVPAGALAPAPGFISGVVRRAGGGIEIDPLAVAAGGTVVVPDLAAGGAGELEARRDEAGEALPEALEHAIALLAEVPHRGLRHLPPGFGDRLRRAGDGLNRVGLHRAAEALTALERALGPDPGEGATGAWVDAHLRLTVTAELQ